MGLMEKLFGRDWGIHPDDHKRPAADAVTRTMPVPERLFVSLSQHLGAPARPVVLVGQKVRKGERLADPQGAVSAAIHAPTSGTITAIGEIPAPHPSGLPVLAITLEADGLDAWADLEGLNDPFLLPPAEISKKVAEAGVVGLGGATFPAALKLSLSEKAKVTTLVMNGGECEPYLSCDDRLMRDSAAAIVDGIGLMLHATGATQALVGIEDNKPEAIAAMQQAAAAQPHIRICPVPARYPMGSEKQLVQELTGHEIPADGRPGDVGVVVHNVGTAWAVHQAIRFGRPLVARLITVNGGCVAQPGNIMVPLGTLVEEVLAFAGGLNSAPARLVMGGPMMGMSLPQARVPVVKGSSGILALSAAEVAERTEEPCIRCATCVGACPMGLLPLDMARHIQANDLKGAVKTGLKDCIACGCCAYVCPAHIPLVQYFSHAKGELSAQEREKLRQESNRKLAQSRAQRLEREAREKAEAAARRKAERAAQAAATPESQAPSNLPAPQGATA